MYNKIIWANDGSPTMERVYPVVRDLARDNGASVVLAHVQETMRIGQHPLFADSHRALDSFLQGTVDQLTNDGVDAELVLTETRSGRAAQAIADLAVEADADVIVAGTHGQGPVAGFFLGGFTIALLQIAPCPVLVVPRHSHEDDRVALAHQVGEMAGSSRSNIR